MIILNIVVSDKQDGERLIEILLEKKYAVSVQMDEEKQHVANAVTVLLKRDSFKISFITKALLYKEIERELNEFLGDKLKMIYSIPVSQMNEDYAKFLKDQIKKS